MGSESVISEIFAHQEKLLGQSVVISAVLVLRGGECYLVPSLDSHDAVERIEIYAPGLEKRLNASVGGWVGGPAIYFDTVKVVGVLHSGTTRRNPLSISDLRSLVLYRDGETYQII